MPVWFWAKGPPACVWWVMKTQTKIAALEREFKELGNSIGMGAMGFVGKSMVIDCHIELVIAIPGHADVGACVLFVFKAGSRPDPCRRPGRVSHRP